MNSVTKGILLGQFLGYSKILLASIFYAVLAFVGLGIIGMLIGAGVAFIAGTDVYQAASRLGWILAFLGGVVEFLWVLFASISNFNEHVSKIRTELILKNME